MLSLELLQRFFGCGGTFLLGFHTLSCFIEYNNYEGYVLLNSICPS